MWRAICFSIAPGSLGQSFNTSHKANTLRSRVTNFETKILKNRNEKFNYSFAPRHLKPEWNVTGELIFVLHDEWLKCLQFVDFCIRKSLDIAQELQGNASILAGKIQVKVCGDFRFLWLNLSGVHGQCGNSLDSGIFELLDVRLQAVKIHAKKWQQNQNTHSADPICSQSFYVFPGALLLINVLVVFLNDCRHFVSAMFSLRNMR